MHAFSAGKYCDSDGLAEPVDDCVAGWYCSGGAYSSTPVEYISSMTGFTINVSCPTYLTNDTGGPCLAGKCFI